MRFVAKDSTLATEAKDRDAFPGGQITKLWQHLQSAFCVGIQEHERGRLNGRTLTKKRERHVDDEIPNLTRLAREPFGLRRSVGKEDESPLLLGSRRPQ